MIAVAATDRDDNFWDGSNYGASIDLAAPGSEIFSTGAAVKDPFFAYYSGSGTSLAAPHVSGVAALMIELDPGITAAEIKQVLVQSVDALPALKGKVRAGGRLNAFKALQMVRALKTKHLESNTGPASAAGNCNYDSSKKILAKAKNSFTAEWTLTESADLYQPYVPDSKAFNDYAAWAHAHTKVFGIAAVQLELNLWIKYQNDLSPNDPGRAEMQKGIDQLQLEVDGKVGAIRTMQCLESIPFREFMTINDLTKFPEEFDVTIFKKNNQLKMIGTFVHLPHPSQAEGTEDSPAAQAEENKLAKAGWTPYIHLHNHPYLFDPQVEDLGGNLAPSDADILSYLQLNPERALITNGMETVELNRHDFLLLK